VDVGAGALAACFAVVPIGFNGFTFDVQLDAGYSTGSIAEYRWWQDFRFPTQPPSDITTGPLSDIFLHEEPGPVTIRLEVLDATGATAETTQVYDVVFP
jgi:hypothetical protein